MGRKHRRNEPNLVHSVKIAGLDELSIFKSIMDKAHFIMLIVKFAIIYHINVYGYTFKENSARIMLHNSKGNLSKFMKCLKGTYSQHYYNVKYGRSGTIYKDRFESKVIGYSINNNFMKCNAYEKLPLNDGNLINFDLDPKTVFDKIKDYFNLDLSNFIYDERFGMSEKEENAISILVFSLRSFCGFIHKKIANNIEGLSERMSSKLSLTGADLIINGRFKEFYFKLLMVIYSDKRNCSNI